MASIWVDKDWDRRRALGQIGCSGVGCFCQIFCSGGGFHLNEANLTSPDVASIWVDKDWDRTRALGQRGMFWMYFLDSYLPESQPAPFTNVPYWKMAPFLHEGLGISLEWQGILVSLGTIGMLSTGGAGLSLRLFSGFWMEEKWKMGQISHQWFFCCKFFTKAEAPEGSGNVVVAVKSMAWFPVAAPWWIKAVVAVVFIMAFFKKIRIKTRIYKIILLDNFKYDAIG